MEMKKTVIPSRKLCIEIQLFKLLIVKKARMQNILSLSLISLALTLACQNSSLNAQAVTKPLTIDASRYSDLQAALNAVPESGAIVMLPPGEFVIDEPLVLATDNTRLQGSGAVTHIINKNEKGEPALLVKSRNPQQWRVELSNFRVSGNPKSGDGIYMEKVQELFITGLAVDHNGRHGIHMNLCTENPRVAHCNITYNAQTGIYIYGGHDIVVNANEFEENQDALRLIDGYNLTMTGNNIDDHLRHGIVIENVYGSVISGNMIEECQGTAIILQAPASPANRHCYGFTIGSNVIAHNLGGGVELTGAWGCSVSSNTFTLVHKHAVYVGPGSGRITITGNNFGNSKGKLVPLNPDNPWTFDICTGIVLEGTSDITVSGNSFCGLITEALKADAACKRLLVASNLISEVNMNAKSPKKAIDTGGARDCVVKNNLVTKDIFSK
jgi:parallel beta-helix repeat protein